jgi:small-conductance mechanosensitive channel
MKRIIKPGPLLVTFDHIIPWIVWFAVAMHLLGWTEPLAGALDSIGIPLGKSRVSLLDLLKAAVTLLLFTIGAAYLSQLASRRIMAIGDIGIGLRVGITKFVKLVLYVLAGVLALDAVGVNLGALTVFGGALGIGLGFGLQRITANFVSGFIIIADRSIRQGDVITIGERLGVVRELRARYIVVQDRDGVDTLIPNENVISSEVINWSYADSAIRLKLPIQISYADNPRQALAILDKAADNHPRVQKTPAPASRLMSFGDNGIDLELRFWIRDPQDGVNNVRSDLYLDIWDMFQDAGITIPFPQRDLHLPRDWPRTAISEEPH